jgi:hypothetical protein
MAASDMPVTWTSLTWWVWRPSIVHPLQTDLDVNSLSWTWLTVTPGLQRDYFSDGVVQFLGSNLSARACAYPCRTICQIAPFYPITNLSRARFAVDYLGLPTASGYNPHVKDR